MSRRRGLRAGRGALFIIAGLLLGSALIRTGNGVGQALARVSADPAAREVGGPGAMGTACETPDDLRAMLTALGERDAELAAREAGLRDRMQALQAADAEVSAKLAELQTAEAALRETIALADSAAKTDLDRLTRVYESMKPKQAAALFEQMTPNFAAGFLGRMRPEAAAGIMASLSPEAAHAFSVVLAGRNAEVPRE